MAEKTIPERAERTERTEKKAPFRKEEEVKSEGEIRFFEGIPAEVRGIVDRAGMRGELTQVMCQILDGRDKDKTLRRNVKGPIRIGDILMLLETEIEAQRVGGGGRKTSAGSGGSSGRSGGGGSRSGGRSGGSSRGSGRSGGSRGGGRR